MRGNTAREPYVATDHAVVADDRVAAQYRRPCIKNDVVFYGWMPLPFSVFLTDTQRAQGDALVYFIVTSYVRCLPDHDAGTVVDTEELTDRGARMNVDARLAMRVLGDDPRDVRHLQFEEDVGDPVRGDGVEARICPDDLVLRRRRRIALKH